MIRKKKKNRSKEKLGNINTDINKHRLIKGKKGIIVKIWDRIYLIFANMF